ncbi:protein misato homolog 1 isoform X2 [Anabrus simplex]|uniref:protein misato homolog 1 isoform X2 n=1 Tax=Anabrus simplex TaxID=316456 RepID=UPI0035A3426D
MASAREIITFQLGHYSNYVGTHWWNIQEYVTYTPRLLLVDLNGSLRHLPKEGDLYDKVPEPSHSHALWSHEKVEIIQSPKESKNEFLEDLDDDKMDLGDAKADKAYNLDNEVTVWSDFLRTRYHPRTVTLIKEYHHANEATSFDVFNYGVNLWKTPEFEDDFCDKISAYAEECDNMQGFHILMDGTDGFGGLGSSVVQYLQDEYPRKSVLAFPAIQSNFTDSSPTNDSLRVINLTLLFSKLAEHSSLFVPLSVASLGWRKPGPPREFRYLRYNNSLPYHSSSILAMALDTLTLRYRLRASPHFLMGEMCHDLSRLGRRAAAASLGVPFAMHSDAFLLETLENWEGPLWQSLTPNCSLEEDRIWMQSVVLRGIPQSRLRSPERKVCDNSNPAYSCKTVQEMLALFLSCCSYATLSHVTTAEFSCRVAPPVPKIFSDVVGPYGSVEMMKPLGKTDVHSVPAIAGIHSSSSVGSMLESLLTEVDKLKIRKFPQYSAAGLEEDEYRETIEQLLQLRECYHEEFDV